MKKLFKILDTRIGFAIFYILVAGILCTILGFLFSLFDSLSSFWFITQYIYVLFGAPSIASAVLLIFTNMNEELTFGFGMGWYYGACLVAYAIEKLGWIIPMADRFLIGVFVSAIVCYFLYQSWPHK